MGMKQCLFRKRYSYKLVPTKKEKRQKRRETLTLNVSKNLRKNKVDNLLEYRQNFLKK